MELTTKDFKDGKHDRYVRAAIVNKEAMIAETYPDIPVAQHRLNALRSKGELNGPPKKSTTTFLDPFTWTNEKYLKRLEEYERELEESYLGDGDFSEDYIYTRKYGR